MAWTLSVTNNYYADVEVLGSPVKSGQSQSFSQVLGNTFISVPGLGAINFIDLGEEQVGGYSKATWGVLISYQGDEVVFRYEGGGQLQVTITRQGQAELGGNGGFSLVRLNSLVIPQS
ncbi:MAG TPA: hypothetical protein VKA60_23975 [Blastocatellia bacterium]|nr:hypothetical protein [Blastocatellia bacterium]